MPTTEKTHIRIWDHDSYSRNIRNQSDLDDMVDRVNRMLGQGWHLTGMEKVTSGQEVKISFGRDVPDQSASPAESTKPHAGYRNPDCGTPGPFGVRTPIG